MSVQPPFLPGGRFLRFLVGGALIVLLALLPLLPLGGGWSPTSCTFYSLTGLPCPLCGGTRAAKAFLQGDLSRAVRLNALAIPAVIVIATMAGVLLVEGLRGRRLYPWETLAQRYGKFLPWVILVLIIWWIPQIAGALRGSKSELLNPQNPVAAFLLRHTGSQNP